MNYSLASVLLELIRLNIDEILSNLSSSLSAEWKKPSDIKAWSKAWLKWLTQLWYLPSVLGFIWKFLPVLSLILSLSGSGCLIVLPVAQFSFFRRIKRRRIDLTVLRSAACLKPEELSWFSGVWNPSAAEIQSAMNKEKEIQLERMEETQQDKESLKTGGCFWSDT